MDYEIEEIALTDKLKKLGLSLPESLSFFPENIENAATKDDFVFTDSMVDLNKLFRLKNITVQALGRDTEFYRSRKTADVYLPAIFFGMTLISQNPAIISITLNVISNYITDFLKGSLGKKTVNIEIYVETKQKDKLNKISYKGNVEGLEGLEKIIKAMR